MITASHAISIQSGAQSGAFCAALEVQRLASVILAKLRAGNATTDVLIEVTELLDAAADTLTTVDERLR